MGLYASYAQRVAPWLCRLLVEYTCLQRYLNDTEYAQQYVKSKWKATQRSRALILRVRVFVSCVSFCCRARARPCSFELLCVCVCVFMRACFVFVSFARSLARK